VVAIRTLVDAPPAYQVTITSPGSRCERSPSTLGVTVSVKVNPAVGTGEASSVTAIVTWSPR
jgi:hypothetical protein